MLTVIAIDSTAERFDIVDAFNRIFWRDMAPEVAIDAVNKLGAGMYRIVEHTGADYGVKVAL